MLRLLGLTVLVAALLTLSPAAAQAEPAFPVLVLASPNDTGMGDGVAVAPGRSLVPILWTLTFPTSASAAAASTGDTIIEWSLDCAEGGFTLQAAPTVVDVRPEQQAYSGTALLNLSASPEAIGLKGHECTLQGTATIPGSPQPSAGTLKFVAAAAFVGTIRIEAPMPSRNAGPDKQVPFPIAVENLGNARIQVSFHVESPRGKWDVLVPDPLVLDSPLAGADGRVSDTVYVTISTSYDNGPNKDSRDFVLLATVQSADQPDKSGPVEEVTLHVDVQGWYIAGPSSPLILLGLIVATLLTRRR